MAEKQFQFHKVSCPNCHDNDATQILDETDFGTIHMTMQLEECLKCHYLYRKLYIGYPYDQVLEIKHEGN